MANVASVVSIATAVASKRVAAAWFDVATPSYPSTVSNAEARFLIVDGIVIPVEPDNSTVALQYLPLGESEWSLEGEAMSDVSGYKIEIPVSSQEMTRSQANAIRDKAIGVMPVLCWGSLLEATFLCDIVFQELRPTALGMARVTFLIRLSSIEDQQVAGIRITPSRSTIGVGAIIELDADACDSAGEAMVATLDWTSSSPGVAMVDGSGKVTGVTPGKAIITATALNGIYASAEVKVS